MYFLSSPIIKKLGINGTLVGIFLIYAERAFLYSFIKDPILAVIVQVTHLSIALFIIASVEYVNLLVPAMWRATGQSLLWVAQFGIGSIVGQLLSGYLYDQVGVQQLFRLSGFILLGVALITMVFLRSNRADLKEPVT